MVSCVCERERERERKKERETGATVGKKELKPRRKYEKEVSNWPPFVYVGTRIDHVGDRMEQWDLGTNKTWFELKLHYVLAV